MKLLPIFPCLMTHGYAKFWESDNCVIQKIWVTYLGLSGYQITKCTRPQGARNWIAQTPMHCVKRSFDERSSLPSSFRRSLSLSLSLSLSPSLFPLVSAVSPLVPSEHWRRAQRISSLSIYRVDWRNLEILSIRWARLISLKILISFSFFFPLSYYGKGNRNNLNQINSLAAISAPRSREENKFDPAPNKSRAFREDKEREKHRDVGGGERGEEWEKKGSSELGK